MLVLRDLRAARALVESGADVPAFTLGGLHYAPGKTKIAEYLYLDDADREDARALLAARSEARGPGRAGHAATGPDGPGPDRRAVSLQVFATLLLGGVAVLDATPVAQTLLSQPLVTATLLGALWGEWRVALEVGVVLQILAASTLAHRRAHPRGLRLAAGWWARAWRWPSSRGSTSSCWTTPRRCWACSPAWSPRPSACRSSSGSGGATRA